MNVNIVHGHMFVAVLHHMRLTCRVALDWRLWTNGLSGMACSE